MREYYSREDWYRRLPIREKIRIRQSQRSRAGFWRRWAAGRLRFAGGALGAVAAAGAANYFAKVPKLDTRPDMVRFPKRLRGRDNLGGEATVTDVSGFNTYNRTRSSSGRRVPYKARLSRILRSEVQPFILRYSAVSPYSGTGGYHCLRNYVHTGGGDNSGSYDLPIHMYNLSAIVNQTNGTALRCGTVGHSVRLVPNVVDEPAVDFRDLRGSKENGDNFGINNYNIETTTHAGTFQQPWPGRRGYHSWSDIRLVLYGMLTTPTKFTVQLVKFTEAYYVPVIERTFGEDAFESAIKQGSDLHNFYADMAKPYVSNPILSQRNRSIASKIIVLKSKDYILQPRSTISSDTDTPTSLEVKWFHRMNRTVSFDWNVDNTPLSTADIQDDAFRPENDASWEGDADFTSRIFLVIKAQALSTSGSTNIIDSSTFSNTTEPSYDIFIRNKYHAIMS